MILAEIIEQSLHYGDWTMVVGWFLIFAVFVAFIPFNRKSQTKHAPIQPNPIIRRCSMCCVVKPS